MRPCLLALASFFVVFGARLCIIHGNGVDVPFMDSWGEAISVYNPFLRGELGIGNLVEPANEHRLFFTRLLALALFGANGQWDSMLGNVAQAALMAVAVAAFILCVNVCARRRLGAAGQWALAMGATALYALPVSWWNILMTQQSQFVFSVGFSFAALLLYACDASTWRRTAGVLLCVLAAMLTNGGGWFVAVGILAAILLRGWRGEYRPMRRANCVLALACTGLIACAAVLTPRAVHQTLPAALSAFFANLRLPMYSAPVWMGLVVCIPLVLGAWHYTFARKADEGLDRLSMALSAWAVIGVGVLSFVRGEGHWRHVDTVMLVPLASLIAAVNLLTRAGSARGKMALRVVLLAAVMVAAIGFCLETRQNLRANLPYRRWQCAQHLANTAAFVRTGDKRHLAKEPEREIPLNDPEVLREVLSDPLTRTYLPMTIAPLPAFEAEQTGAVFRADGRTGEATDTPAGGTWSSFEEQSRQGRVSVKIANPGSLPLLVVSVLTSESTDGLKLRMEDVQGRRRPLSFAGAGGGWWRQVYIRNPGGPVRLVAETDGRPGEWLAFSLPGGMGKLGRMSRRVLAADRVVLCLGALLLLGMGTWNVSGNVGAGRRDEGGNLKPEKLNENRTSNVER